MITGEDYNIAPLSVNQQVIKVKSVNRSSSGISRYFDLVDPTGKYSKTNLFADDGALYKEEYDDSFRFSYVTKTDIEAVIYNQLSEVLKSKQLRDFYNNWWVDTTKEGDLGLIICIKGQIYEHNAIDMSLSKYNLDYLAMGSGAEYAYGYLNATEKSKDPRKRVVGAVSAAVKFSPSCMGPVDVVNI
jgi:hypothetical protein